MAKTKHSCLWTSGENIQNVNKSAFNKIGIFIGYGLVFCQVRTLIS